MHEFASNLYVQEAYVRFYGFRLQTRMAVVVLPGRRLLLYSPVWLEPEVRSALERLGVVTYILSPNKIHNQALDAYAKAYPDAEIHVPPGLGERCRELRVSGVLIDEPNPAWAVQIDQALTAGNTFFSEAVLLHRESRTLLVGDLIEHLNDETISTFGQALVRLFGIGREPTASPEFRLYTQDADAAEKSLARIAGWDFDRIFLCHGAMITAEAGPTFRAVAEELLRAVRSRSRISRWLMRKMAAVQ